MYDTKMQFEWDKAKNQKNLAKHGITFELAQEIFAHKVVTLEDVRLDYGEKRMVAIGVLQEGVYLMVVYTKRQNKTRIISARKANKQERRLYEKTYA